MPDELGGTIAGASTSGAGPEVTVWSGWPLRKNGKRPVGASKTNAPCAHVAVVDG
jgi:hypothetical protein